MCEQRIRATVLSHSKLNLNLRRSRFPKGIRAGPQKSYSPLCDLLSKGLVNSVKTPEAIVKMLLVGIGEGTAKAGMTFESVTLRKKQRIFLDDEGNVQCVKKVYIRG